jgi:hypothetical protein
MPNFRLFVSSSAATYCQKQIRYSGRIAAQSTLVKFLLPAELVEYALHTSSACGRPLGRM